MNKLLYLLLLLVVLDACAQKQPEKKTSSTNTTISMDDNDWKKKLTAEQYHILREKGTERAFTGKYWDHYEEGVYVCAGCETPLFQSDTKYESSCGWPSYFSSLEDKIEEKIDKSFGMVRTEVVCKKCGGHLGHVFNDGPPPTGLRYCINSEALLFKKGK